MTIGSTIRRLRKARHLTLNQLAVLIDSDVGNLSRLERGLQGYSDQILGKLATALDVPVATFFIDENVERHSELDEPIGLKPGTFKRVEAVEEGDPRMALIPRVRLRLRAGMNEFEVEAEPGEDTNWMIPTAWISAKGFKRKNLISIGIDGESMEPNFYQGDSVILNIADKEPTDGGVFAVNYEGEAVVKRMMRDEGQWWLTSDNSDQRKYRRKLCVGDRCIIIGRVVKRETERF